MLFPRHCYDRPNAVQSRSRTAQYFGDCPSTIGVPVNEIVRASVNKYGPRYSNQLFCALCVLCTLCSCMTSSSCSIFDGGIIGWTLSLASVDCIQCSKRHMSFSNCDQFCSEHSGHIAELLFLKKNMAITKIIMTYHILQLK